RLAEAQAKITDLTVNFNEHTVDSDSQRIDLVTLRAQVEVLKAQVESYEIESRTLQERLTRRTAEAESANQQLAEERVRSENLSTHVSDLDRQIIAQSTEAEILGR